MTESVNSEWSETLKVVVVPRILTLASSLADTVPFTTTEQETIDMSTALRERLDYISGQRVGYVNVTERHVRGIENIRKGEHAGFWISAALGRYELEANFFGGIRDPKTRADMLDNVTRALTGQSHSGRTIGLGDKPTQINIQIKEGRILTDEIWAKDFPGSNPHIDITSFRVDNSHADVSTQSPVRIGRATDTWYNYVSFHQEITSLIDLFLHNTRNI